MPIFNDVGWLIWGLTSHQQLRSDGDDPQFIQSHPTDWSSLESNLQPLVYKASDITTAPRRLLYNDVRPGVRETRNV